MTKIIFVLSLFFCTSSFAHLQDAYIQYFVNTTGEIEKIRKKLNIMLNLQPQYNSNESAKKSCEQYFGKADLNENEIKKYKNLLKYMNFICSQLLLHKNKIEQNNLMFLIDENLVRRSSFMVYIQMLKPIKKIQRKLTKYEDIFLKKDLEKILNSLLSVRRFFGELELYLEQFLIISTDSTKDVCDVRLSMYSVLLDQKRQIKNIVSMIDMIDLSKFDVNKKYISLLNNEFKKIKKASLNLIGSKKISVDQHYRNGFKINLFDDNVVVETPNALLVNKKTIEAARNIAIHPFHLIFENTVSLTMDELMRVQPIYFEMISNMDNLLIEENLQRDVNIKKEKIKDKPLNKPERTDIEKIEENDKDAYENPTAPIDNETKSDVHNFSEEMVSSATILSVPILVNDDQIVEELPEELIDVLDINSLDECKNWLRQIMLNTSSKEGAYFTLFYKASALYKDLEKSGELILEQIQQGTAELALRIQAIQLNENNQNDDGCKMIVSKNYERVFQYFMYTPLSFLKDKIRFGFVERLIAGLGGIIQKSREGSRMALHLNGQTIGLHLHDSVNGILDSGRINALRKFFINTGFVLSDN